MNSNVPCGNQPPTNRPATDRLTTNQLADSLVTCNHLIRTSQLNGRLRKLLYKLHRNGHMIKLGPGVYFPRSSWDHLGPDRLALRAAACLPTVPGSLIVGISAVELHGVAISYGIKNTSLSSTLHVGVPYQSHVRAQPGVHFHRMDTARTPATTLRAFGVNIQLSTVAAAVLDMARFHGTTAGLISLENAWNRRLLRAQDLRDYLRVLEHKHGFARARSSLSLACPWSESPRETELRLKLLEHGMPLPLKQVEIYDHRGTFVARVDFLFPKAGLVLEYEGAAKTSGPEAGRTALRELPRSRELHNLGLMVYHVDALGFRDAATFRQLKDIYQRRESLGCELPPKLWIPPPTPEQWDRGEQYWSWGRPYGWLHD